jgi:hypothetical protein
MQCCSLDRWNDKCNIADNKHYISCIICHLLFSRFGCAYFSKYITVFLLPMKGLSERQLREYGCYDLAHIAAYRTLDRLKFLAESVKDINAPFTGNGRTILQFIANVGWYEGVKYLCSIKNIDVNVTAPFASWYPTCYAIQSPEPESYLCVYHLLERGGILNADIATTRGQSLNIQAWIDAQQEAFQNCKRACLTVLWAKTHMPSALKDALVEIARMVLQTRRKRHWFKGYNESGNPKTNRR